MNLFESTLDLDRDSGKIRTLTKILKCKDLINLRIERSSSKRGWHIIILCNKSCLDCREQFDDRTRFNADLMNRHPHEQNVIFGKKTRFYPDKGIKIIAIKEGFVDPEGEVAGAYPIQKKEPSK